MKLIGEVCDREFEATKERPINICLECIERLRKKGLGPCSCWDKRKLKS